MEMMIMPPTAKILTENIDYGTFGVKNSGV